MSRALGSARTPTAGRPAIPVLAAALALATALLAAAPVAAFDVFLDADVDGDPSTFRNEVVGPVTVPVDLVLRIDPADLGDFPLEIQVAWGYGGAGEDPGCYDVYGGIHYIPDWPLPDSGPFTDIVPFTCLCLARCECDAMMVVDAQAAGITQPGFYRLATLDFTREGFAQDCSSPVYESATFRAGCHFPACDSTDDPRAQLVIRAAPTAVDAQSWGRAKARYRER